MAMTEPSEAEPIELYFPSQAKRRLQSPQRMVVELLIGLGRGGAGGQV